MKKSVYIYIAIIALLLTACASKQSTGINTFNNYPYHFIGIVPGANCQHKYQLDLFSNNTYFLRQSCYKDNDESKNYNYDDIGLWSVDNQNRLLLNGSKEDSIYFYVVDEKTIELMDSDGNRIDSKVDYKLKHIPDAKTIQPTLVMNGMYSYMADSAIFKECTTGQKFPVSLVEDHRSLEKAYLKTSNTPGEELKAHIQGSIKFVQGVDNQGVIPTIIVEKFIDIIPGEICEEESLKPKLTGTYWKLTKLNKKVVQQTNNTSNKNAHVIFENGRISGYSGCNFMNGSYTIDGDKIFLSNKNMAVTRMFCQESIETEFLEALQNMNSYKLEGRYLQIFDKNNKELMQFDSYK